MRRITFKQRLITAAILLAIAGCNAVPSTKQDAATASIAQPHKWPEVSSKVKSDQNMETRIQQIVSGMTLEQKIAQMVQPEIRAITAEDMRRYGFGSYLNGGGSFPGGDKHAEVADWLALADMMYKASVDDSLDNSSIPTMWGTDAVHGHNNVIGAVLYPHNIGLGAMNNPALIEKIGAATAKAVQATGIEWVFAPTVAVARDDRWGRTYESYSEDPAIVKTYAAAMVNGLQGEVGENFLGDGKVIATAKHFLGDGGTEAGDDQGNNLDDEQQLIDIHAQGYVSAIEEGVQTVMASFSSWQGNKMHGNQSLLTDVLKDRMGFDGLVVGDWDGHGQVKGCTPESCAQAINAGVDIIMVPFAWKPFYDNTLQQAQSGEIPIARIDDAVSRILRVKMRAGLFDGQAPSERAFAKQPDVIGSAEHRALARQAVRESLVLLKNKNNVLPLERSLNVLVAGKGADNIGKQSGGWSITWLGTGNANEDFPGATSVFDGIQQGVNSAGGTAQLNVKGDYSNKPDVAIVVFGEEPYAEGVGDISAIEYQHGNKRDLELLKKLKADGIPVVSVFLTGRPLWINKELNASDAFVVAWLPGTEGAGIADVIFRDASGDINYDFQGKLSFSWPKSDAQVVLNKGDKNYDPLFPLGYGLTYRDNDSLGDNLSENATVEPARTENETLALFDTVPKNDLSLFIGNTANMAIPVTSSIATATGTGNLTLKAADRKVQEDARQVAWEGNGPAFTYLAWESLRDLRGFITSNSALTFDIKVDQAPSADLAVIISCGQHCSGAVGIEELLREQPIGEWQTVSVDLACFAEMGARMDNVVSPFALATEGSAEVTFANVKIEPQAAPQARIRCD